MHMKYIRNFLKYLFFRKVSMYRGNKMTINLNKTRGLYGAQIASDFCSSIKIKNRFQKTERGHYFLFEFKLSLKLEKILRTLRKVEIAIKEQSETVFILQNRIIMIVQSTSFVLDSIPGSQAAICCLESLSGRLVNLMRQATNGSITNRMFHFIAVIFGF